MYVLEQLIRRQVDGAANLAAQFPVPLAAGLFGGADVHLGGRSLVRVADRGVWHQLLTDLSSGSLYGLINGGKGGMVYTYLGGLFGFSFVILSMAEMASM